MSEIEADMYEALAPLKKNVNEVYRCVRIMATGLAEVLRETTRKIETVPVPANISDLIKRETVYWEEKKRKLQLGYQNSTEEELSIIEDMYRYNLSEEALKDIKYSNEPSYEIAKRYAISSLAVYHLRTKLIASNIV